MSRTPALSRAPRAGAAAISEIRVEEGQNARKKIDPEALKRLAESIKKTGVVEPIVMTRRKNH
ncbi:MAG TPA: ParB N-terminal domain-containing protein [Solirubrobacterales bacterium]|jgi:ParB-like chromosome segregation protein Spo0J|nr:ParB N-terminal domain-containing protein [Solirubrobacterales bacterium]